MNGISVHYGEMLTDKIRESTADFSKLSDFDKFVLDNGYKCESRVETVKRGRKTAQKSRECKYVANKSHNTLLRCLRQQ